MPLKQFITIAITKESQPAGNWHFVIATDRRAHKLTAMSEKHCDFFIRMSEYTRIHIYIHTYLCT